jgi:uncharacterized membrane protein
MPPRTGSRHRTPALLRIVRARLRLFACGAIGAVVVGVAFAANWRPETRLLTGWDVGVALYLALVFQMMGRSSTTHTMRRHAAEQDEGRLTMLVLTVAAALASLAAIFAVLGGSAGTAGNRPAANVALPAFTILLSWAFIHTIFALHYAHEFYDETDGGGLAFPGDREPDYWDFVYFSFVIGMTSQVSDVAITSKLIRRTAAAHGVVSFVFNVALLALTINLAASVL